MQNKALMILAVALAASAGMHACLAQPAEEAGEAEEASVWLTKMALAANEPFKVRYAVQSEVAADGSDQNVTMSGELLQIDRKHTRSGFTATIQSPETPDSMTVSALMVGDGTTMWTEIEDPATGGKHVRKLAIDQMDEIANSDPRLASMQPRDPVGEIQRITERIDFTDVEVSDGRVTLSASLTEEALLKLGQVMPSDAPDAYFELILVLDEKTALPVEMHLGANPAWMSIQLSGFEKVDTTGVDPSAFEYTPPEGADVVDLGAWLDKVSDSGGS